MEPINDNTGWRPTSPEDMASIKHALCSGLKKLGVATVEEALAAVDFHWPRSAPARALGTIVRNLAAAKVIEAQAWEHGRSTRCHQGRVTRWQWIGGAA